MSKNESKAKNKDGRLSLGSLSHYRMSGGREEEQTDRKTMKRKPGPPLVDARTLISNPDNRHRG